MKKVFFVFVGLISAGSVILFVTFIIKPDFLASERNAILPENTLGFQYDKERFLETEVRTYRDIAYFNNEAISSPEQEQKYLGLDYKQLSEAAADCQKSCDKSNDAVVRIENNGIQKEKEWALNCIAKMRKAQSDRAVAIKKNR